MSENLIPFTQRSKEEARELSAKGGRRSGETRRRKRDMKAKLKMLLELPCTDTDSFNEVSCMGVDMGDIDNATVMMAALIKKAIAGDVNAIKTALAILGEDNAAEELKIKKAELELKQTKENDTAPNNKVVIIDDV